MSLHGKREEHDVITRVIQRRRPRRSAALATGATLILAAGLSTASVLATWLTDSGTVDAQVPSGDYTTSVVDATTAQGAYISYFGDAGGTQMTEPYK